MTPLCGRGFLVNSTKKPWTKPEVRQFETPEQLLAFYRQELSDEDLQRLIKLAEQLQRSARRSAGGSPLRKLASG
jgi:hypothetical protein